MMRVIFIVGLPASGKSHYIQSIIQEGDLVLDDFITLPLLKEALEKNPERLILSDPFFCVGEIRRTVLSYIKPLTRDIEKIFFKNDPKQCLINAKNRPDKKVDSFIDYLTKRYSPPMKAREVYHE